MVGGISLIWAIRCLSQKASPSNDDPHSWVLGQPFSVVGVLIASKTAVYRLPDQSHQLVLDVATTPALLQTGGCCLRQSQGIIPTRGRLGVPRPRL